MDDENDESNRIRRAVEKIFRPFEERRARASARLTATTDSGRYWYFGIIGLMTELSEFSFDSIGLLQAVEDPPGSVELATALKDSSLVAPIARYSHSIGFELKISRDLDADERIPFRLAEAILSALRSRTLAEILIPAALDNSWSTIAGLGYGTCEGRLIEDVPMAHRLSSTTVMRTDLEWVSLHLESFAELRAFVLQSRPFVPIISKQARE